MPNFTNITGYDLWLYYKYHPVEPVVKSRLPLWKRVEIIERKGWDGWDWTASLEPEPRERIHIRDAIAERYEVEDPLAYSCY